MFSWSLQPQDYFCESPQVLMGNLLARKIQSQPLYSMRSFAKKVEVKPSTMSGYLNGQFKISVDAALKIGTRLAFSEKELDFFLTLALNQSATDSLTLGFVQEKLEKFRVQDSSSFLTQRVQGLLKTSETRKQLFYVRSGSNSLRILSLLKDKKTGQPIPDFYDQFVCPRRGVSSTSFFLKNADGSFSATIQLGLEIKNSFEVADPLNSSVEVQFQEDGLPRVRNLILTQLAQDSFIRGELVYGRDAVSIRGHEKTTDNAVGSKRIEHLFLSSEENKIVRG